MRPTSAQIDLEAIAHNVALLVELAAPAQLCVVVKADGYGHGALPVARTALAAGAGWLAVALVEEGIELRQGGVQAPILLLSEPRPQELVEVIEHDLRPTIYSPTGAAAVAAAATAAASAAGAASARPPVAVHLKVDTGMQRVGADPAAASRLAESLREKPDLELEGVWTHLATADDLSNPFAKTQISRFDDFLSDLRRQDITPKLRHAGNSAVLLAHREAHYDLVRAGLVVYGISPLKHPDPAAQAVISQLRPAMRLSSQVSFAKEVAAGTGISYGQLHTFAAPTEVATVPIGYADGIRRNFGLIGGQVLIGGQRRPVLGAVTMDQLMAEAPGAQPGEEVVLLGRQGDEELRAEELAECLETIPYEIVCDVGKRVRREYI